MTTYAQLREDYREYLDGQVSRYMEEARRNKREGSWINVTYYARQAKAWHARRMLSIYGVLKREAT